MFLTMGTFLYILPAIWIIWRRIILLKEQLTEEILTVAADNVTNIDLLNDDKKKIKNLRNKDDSV